jgi:hypothetical protein
MVTKKNDRVGVVLAILRGVPPGWGPFSAGIDGSLVGTKTRARPQ